MASVLKRCWGGLTLLGVIGWALVGAPQPAAACSYRVQGWYVVSATLRTPPLPTGVTVVQPPSESSGASGKMITISNTTATPLYIIANFMTGEDTFEPIDHTFSDGRGPTHKVVDGAVWKWSPPTWQLTSDAMELYIRDDAMSTNEGYVTYFTSEIGDNRPDNVTPPPPEQLDIPLVYGTELITISIDVSYALNPGYNPHAMQQMAEVCRRLDNNPGSIMEQLTSMPQLPPVDAPLANVTPAPTATPAAPTATLEARPPDDRRPAGASANAASGAGAVAPWAGATALIVGLIAWRRRRPRP